MEPMAIIYDKKNKIKMIVNRQFIGKDNSNIKKAIEVIMTGYEFPKELELPPIKIKVEQYE